MAVESQREVALRALRRHLAATEDESGRLPPERELASQMKVGRRTVREALSVLEAEGAIWRRQGQGTFFGPPRLVGEREVAELAHRVNPLEIVEARLSIEPVLARLAAMRASLADIEAMTRIAEKARTAKNARDYARADAGFHRKIAECAGNAMFRAMFEMIIRVREKADWTRVRQYYFRHDGARRSYEEHKVVIDAIGERDPQAAAAAMQDHLRKVSASLLGADSPVTAQI
jgi:DNA-binding FadR family transcriptional regulator